MTLLKNILLFLIVSLTLNVSAQKPVINILDSGRKTSLRGLSVVDNNIVWASGSNGTVARSTNGGKTFEWLTVQGYEQRDFRDIEAFDANTALIMAVAEPAIILKTKDGGKTWKKVFEDTTKGMFLDAMDFADDKNGVVVGDPIGKYFFFAFSNDGGNAWRISTDTGRFSKAFPNEAFFAASGTNIKFIKSNNKLMRFYVTGGGRSRIFSDEFGISNLDIISGKESQGANSMCIKNNNIVVVGGDFANDSSTLDNCVLVNFNGDTSNYSYPHIPPHGYRSCAEYITKDKLITCGTSGVDISNDGGMNWELISTKSFHVCQKAKKGNKVFLAGANGKIAKLLYK
jgi:hypothetical protein